MTTDALNLIVLMLGMLCFAGTIIYVLWKCFDPKDPMMNSHISAMAHVSPFFTERLLYYKKDGVVRSIFDDEGNKTRKKVRFFLDNPNDFSPEDQEDPDAEADAETEEAGTRRDVPPPEDVPLDTYTEIDETKARGIDKAAEVEVKDDQNGEKNALDVYQTPPRTYDDKKPDDATKKGRCPLILKLFKHLERKDKKCEPSDSEHSEYGTSVPYRLKGAKVEPKPKIMDDIPELELYKNDSNNTYLYPPRLLKSTRVQMMPRAYKGQKEEDKTSEWVKVEMRPNRNQDQLMYGKARGYPPHCAQISGYAVRTPLSMFERRVPCSPMTKQETDAETKIEFENEEERKLLEMWDSKIRQESQAPKRTGTPKSHPPLRCLPDKKGTPKSESLASTERIEIIDEKYCIRKFGGKSRDKEKATPEHRSKCSPMSQSESFKSPPPYQVRLSPAAKPKDESKSSSKSPVQKSGLGSDEIRKHFLNESCVVRRKEGGKPQEYKTPHIVVIDEVHSVISKSQRKRPRQRGVVRRTPLPTTPSKSAWKEPQVTKVDERYTVVKKCPSQTPKQHSEVPRSGKKRSPMSGGYQATVELSPTKLLAGTDYANKSAQVQKGKTSEEPKQPVEQKKQWEPEFHKMGGRKPYMPMPAKGTPMKRVESEKSFEKSETRSKAAMSGLKKLRLINKKSRHSEEKPKKSVTLPVRSNSDSPVLVRSQKSSSAVDKSECKKSQRVWNIPILTKWENPLHKFHRMFMAKEIPVVVEKQEQQKPILKTPVTSIKVEYVEETMKPAQNKDSVSHGKRVVSQKTFYMSESSVERKEKKKEKPVSESTKSKSGVAEKKSCAIDEQQSVKAYETKAAKVETRSQMETSKERLMDKRSHYSGAAGEINARTPGMTGEKSAASKTHANKDLKTPVQSDDFSTVATINLREGKKEDTEELKPWDLIKKLSDEQNARLAHWKEDKNELETEIRNRTAVEDARFFVRKHEAGKRLKLVKKLDAGMDANAMGDRLVTQKYQHPESMKVTDGRSPAFFALAEDAHASNQNLKQQGGTRQFECKVGNITINMSQSEHVTRNFDESEGFAKGGRRNEATTKNLMHETSSAQYRSGDSNINAPEVDERAKASNETGQANQSDEEKPKKIDPWFISKDVYELQNKEIRRQSPARSANKTPEKKSETLTDNDSSTEGSQSGSPTVIKHFGPNGSPRPGSAGNPNRADKMKKRDRPPRRL